MYKTKFILVLLSGIVGVTSLSSCYNKTERSRNYYVKETISPMAVHTQAPLYPPIFRTITGKCYHLEDCFYLESKILITPKEAIQRNLRACSFCKPPNIYKD